MRLLAVMSLASMASAHTLFTTLFVNGKNQGEGTCVREPKDGATSTAPIYPLTGDVMACGRDGAAAVPYVCPTPGGATLTFEFRSWANGDKLGSIDPSHKGPCSVYLKKVDDMFSDSAAGDGWFKIWDDGYDASTETWCVDTLIKNGGLLSVDLPTGLPAGYYLARPEIIALHQSSPDNKNDPQFYHSCAQIFIENGPDVPLEIPSEFEVSIPGYIKPDHPGLTINIYYPKVEKYDIPGPKVYRPSSSNTGTKKTLGAGAIPKDCVIKNANWCAKPIAKFSGDGNSCWAGAETCWKQGQACFDSAPPAGYKNCGTWNDYCQKLSDQCEAGNFNGPIPFEGEEHFVELTAAIPQQYKSFDETNIDSGATAPAPSKTVAEPVKETAPAKSEKGDETTPSQQPKPDAPEDVKESPTPQAPATGEGVSPVPEQPLLKVSKNGRCGGTTGQTCVGSSFGDCCSKKGRCGRKTRHCTCGCQPEFGNCKDY